MSNKFPIYLAKIETFSDGTKKFEKEKIPYKEIIWGTAYSKHLFDLRQEYFDKPNCNFHCPPGKEYFCCKELGCKKNCGFFEWDEISFFSDKEREKILSLWNNGSGFYREKGCSLPRELRSFVCLQWSCRYSKTKNIK